ncbi:MAG: hypothetical protein GTO17_08075 [Candidatus Aminicenantes bacterium]|nr:hypothetical protein [Candidatus Aminicenantes bacterium]
MKRIKKYILDHLEGAIVALIILGIVAIAFLVYYKYSFLNFFFLPVILAGYFLGGKKAVLAGISCILLVVLYLIFSPLIFGRKVEILLDTVINLLTWGSFLILAGYLVGNLFEQKESRLKSLKQAYVGSLEIVLKYLEVADKVRPPSVRVSLLAGRIAEAAGLKTSEIENIKSAALLSEAGIIRDSLPFFEDAADFVASRKEIDQSKIGEREKIILSSTGSLLKAIEPILAGYFHHYVEGAEATDKNLAEIPLGSSIIAIAKLYEKQIAQMPAQEGGGVIKWEDVDKLSDRTFPADIVKALKSVVSSS